MHPDIKRILISEADIQERVKEIASQITNDCKDKKIEEILIIGVLKGAFIFMADLTRHLSIPHQVDFIALSSYGDTSIPSGVVRLLLDLDSYIGNQHIIIVEDIIDTGYTLSYLHKHSKLDGQLH